MRKQFILLIVVLVAGSLAMLLSYFLSVHNREIKVLQDKQSQETKRYIINNEITAKPTLLDKSKQQNQLVIRGKNKMYFENIRDLAPYFKADQVENIKQRVETYVHLFISNDLLECALKPESLKQVDNNISFELTMKNVKRFEVHVTRDKDHKIIDITMLNGL